MTALFVLIPVALVGLVAWIAVAVRHARHAPLTLPGLASLYASLATVVGVTLALLGIAVAVKVVLGFINLAWSYASPASIVTGGSASSPSSECAITGVNCASSGVPDFTPLRTNDLVLAITLIVVGVVTVLLHRLLARGARRLPGGLPGFVHLGTIMSFAMLYAAAALLGLVGVVYGVVTYFIAPSNASLGSSVVTQSPFGDVTGVAAAFIPAWIVTFILLWRRLRRPAPAPPPMSAPGVAAGQQ